MGPILGVAALVVTFGGIVVAIALSPAFSVGSNALSNLGDAGDPAGTTTTELLFNGGLILGGLAGAGFGAWLFTQCENHLQRLGTGVFVAALLSMGAVGVFPQDGPYHFQVAVGFYMLFSLGALLSAIGQFLAKARRLAVVSVATGSGNLLTWIGWTQTGGLDQPGLAIPELIGAVLVGVWTLTMVWAYHDDRTPATKDPFSWGV